MTTKTKKSGCTMKYLGADIPKLRYRIHSRYPAWSHWKPVVASPHGEKQMHDFYGIYFYTHLEALRFCRKLLRWNEGEFRVIPPVQMTDARYDRVSESGRLTQSELRSGWHWCFEYDLLLSVKGEQPGCKCE